MAWLMCSSNLESGVMAHLMGLNSLKSVMCLLGISQPLAKVSQAAAERPEAVSAHSNQNPDPIRRSKTHKKAPQGETAMISRMFCDRLAIFKHDSRDNLALMPHARYTALRQGVA